MCMKQVSYKFCLYTTSSWVSFLRKSIAHSNYRSRLNFSNNLCLFLLAVNAGYTRTWCVHGQNWSLASMEPSFLIHRFASWIHESQDGFNLAQSRWRCGKWSAKIFWIWCYNEWTACKMHWIVQRSYVHDDRILQYDDLILSFCPETTMVIPVLVNLHA